MYWTDKEKQYLKENYTKLGPVEMAKRLNKSLPAIHSAAYRSGLTMAKKKVKNLPSEAEVKRYKAELRDILGVGKESSLC